MESSSESRNKKVYELLTIFLKHAQLDPTYSDPFNKEEVETLFDTTIWGHRELILTILLTKLVFKDYKPTEDLYAHHPRSVYEKPIRTALRENGIPHKKSGPLNVAKNIKRLNQDWARDKNDEKVALSAVSIAEKIEQSNSEQLKSFALAYISRYKLEAQKVKDLEVNLPAQENPIYISELCADLINDVPDGGATAQFIVGLLMEVNKDDRNSDVLVSGYLDSVSATNTTSKKPGDVIELLNNSEQELVYEITTKAFVDSRMIESHEAVVDYGKDIPDVFVICRPSDVPEALETTSTSLLMAYTQYKQLSYYFINIYQYIQSSLLFITAEARAAFYEQLIIYVNDTNRSEKVKVYFADWHKQKS